MGLNTTHGAFDGAYSSFHNFRVKLAAHIGINLNEMKGFNLNEAEAKSWSEVKSKLKYLLNHSDCDGYITPKRCKMIADELKVIVDELPKEGEDFEYPFTLRGRCETFMNGCLRAYKKNQRLEFY